MKYTQSYYIWSGKVNEYLLVLDIGTFNDSYNQY